MFRYWFVFSAVFSILLLSIFNTPTVNAVEVKDLYVAKVAVNSQSRNDRNVALKQALELVLVKIGGHKSVLSHQEIKKHLGRYNNFLTNYRYEREGRNQFLLASFDQTKINELFVDANLPIWGSLRPQVVLWLVNEQDLTRELVLTSMPSVLTQTVKDFSISRGLPVVLSSLEFMTDNQVTVSDVWGRFKQPIFQASEQFMPEAIVIIRVSNNTLLSEEQLALAENCQLLCQAPIALDWSFISTANNDQTQRFSERYYGIDRSELITQALSDITDDIYQRYALTTDENNQFEMDIANVDSLATYVQVSQFLQQLSAVQSIKLVQAVGSIRRFQLTLLGSEQALLSSLKLHKSLQQYIDPLDPTTQQGVPLFYWESK